MTVSDADASLDPSATLPEEEAAKEKPKLNLDVRVDTSSACGRHVTVTVAKEDVERYFDESYTEMMPNAQVPGFRSGRAPRKLVESRFKPEITEKVKGSLLMDSMSQVTVDSEFAAISEPEFDFDAIELEPGGPFTFEFDIEVRPEFDMPAWKGMKIERPVREFTREDVDKRLEQMLRDTADLVPHEEPAAAEDFVMAQIEFKDGNKVVSECVEELRIVPRISFPDAVLEGFDKLMIGAKVGDRREATISISHDAPNVELRGKDVTAHIEVLDVKRLKLPKLDETALSNFGNFASEGDLRDAVKADLERRQSYQQQRRIRQQITALLTESADWDLPKEMLRRQASRELERAVLELRSSGFGEDEIRAFENDLRQNSMESTKTALKEHFILERLAEEEEIDEAEGDFETELKLIAAQSREPVRRVRARVEKQGLRDAIRNQIVERKVIAKITEHAKFKDVPYQMEESQVYAVDHVVSGVKDSSIPVAKHGGESEELREPSDRS